MSLAYAKAREKTPQQFIGGARAGDFTERALRRAQLFGNQFAGAGRTALRRRGVQMYCCHRQRLEMPAAGREQTGIVPLETGRFKQVRPGAM